MKKRETIKKLVSLAVVLALLAGMMVLPAAAEERTGGSLVGKAYSEDENAYEIYPKPHFIEYLGGSFAMTETVNVVKDGGVDGETSGFLEEILTKFGHSWQTADAPDPATTNIVLSIHGGSDAVPPAHYSDLFTAEDKYDPYILKVDNSENANGVITIIGKDSDCVYYGLATLQMMFTSFNGEKFLNATIEDYANTALRGFIEGFYSGFDYPARESQIRAIRDVKGNMYAFASKTDEYHGGSKWNELYPQEELAQIKNLVDVGKEMKVDYTWSLHIGKASVLGGKGTTISDSLYQERLAQVEAKFDQLYGIGVRNFHILNDDYNSGVPATQVRLLNDINAWLKEKGDCGPLVYCCENYCKAWSAEATVTAELNALRALDEDIYLYWTGDRVNAPMNQPSIDWPKERSDHQVVTWLNYPCSEHDNGTGIYLGDISYYVSEGDGVTGQYGFLSNPIAAAEANKVAYFQLLSWCWNRDNYTDYLTELWEDSFKYLQPEVYDSYLTIARNVSHCPNSGRVGPFPESEYLKEKLENVQAKALAGDDLTNDTDAQALLAEFDHILAAVTDFSEHCANPELKTELTPWLQSLSDVATAGKNGILAVNALAANDISAAWNAFSEGGVALGQWNTHRSVINGSTNTYVKAGSRRLQPFANAVLNYARDALAESFNPGGGLGGRSFYAVLHGVRRTDDTQSAKMFDGNPATFASYHDGTDNQQQAGDYYGVDLGKVELVSAVDILQGENDSDHNFFHQATLECSVDGENWTTLVKKVNSNHIHVEELKVAARYVRLRLLAKGYGGKNDYWTHVREFGVTLAEEASLYTNVAGLTAQPAEDGSVYTLEIPEAALAAGEYVGIKLPEIMGVRAIDIQGNLPAGVVVEHSVNGGNWTEGTPSVTTAMGYVRLYNKGTGSAALSGVTLEAVSPVRTELTFASSNTGVSAGNWTNVVDGDKGTFVHSDAKQAFGQYAIFDLGASQTVEDVAVFVPDEGADIPHNLDVFVGKTSDPGGVWEKIGALRSDGYTVVPPNKVFRCEGGGKVARYIKLAIADVEAANWFRISELEVNKTVPQEEKVGAVSATSGEEKKAVDGNLLTFFAPDDGAGSWQRLFQAPTTVDALTILRSSAGGAGAQVLVEQDGSWRNKGTLADSATNIQISGAITGIKVEWTAGNEPDIAEVILAGEAGATGGETPAQRGNIYEKPADPGAVTVSNGTALADVGLPATVNAVMDDGSTAAAPVVWSCADYDGTAAGTYTFTGTFEETFNPGCFALSAQVTVEAAALEPSGNNLALNKTVYVSGVEVAVSDNTTIPAKAVDGDADTEDSRWSGNLIKTNGSHSWIVVDLGEDVESVTSIAIKYHKKVWPAACKVQVAGSGYTPQDFSEDNVGTITMDNAAFQGQHAQNADCWTTIKTYSNASYDDHPLVTIAASDFEAAVPAGTRYIRLYFTALNSQAAGGAIGLRELTVNGTRGTGEVTQTKNLVAEKKAAWGSGQETANNAPGKAVDGVSSADSRWVGNYMKNHATNPSWIVVDLGENVDTITAVSMDYHMKVWPVDYKIQVAGTNFTPVDHSEENGAGGGTLNANTFTGNNAEDAACWTTIKSVTGDSRSDNPTIEITSFDAAVPEGTRYLRVYYKTMNPAAGGHAISLKEITVTGTRKAAEPELNVVSVAAAAASGAQGTAFEELELPATVAVTLSDDTVQEMAVTWSGDGYDPTAATQILTGTLTLPEGVTNTDGVTAELMLTLTVDPDPDKITITPDRTSLANGGGDVKFTVALADGVEGAVAVTCDVEGITITENEDGTFSATLPKGTKNYTFTATVTTADGETFTATCSVRVRPAGGTISGGTTGTTTGNTTGTTTTETKEDGTTVTTTKKHDGTVTQVTETPDGTKETVETKVDGTITETVEAPNGAKEVVETKPDGTVTETVTDAEGAKTEKVTTPEKDVTITVTDPEGEKLAEVTLPAEIAEPETKFEDVPETHWAEKAINTMASLGVVNGVGDNKYDTASAMTRGSLATVLHRLSNGKTDYEVAFADVAKDKFYADGVAWAAKAGVVTGISEKEFAPEKIITREQLAVMLTRYAKLLGMDTKADAKSLEQFTDGTQTGAWAVDGMAWCVENGILQGKGRNDLDPTAEVSRAEVAVMLDRFIALVK